MKMLSFPKVQYFNKALFTHFSCTELPNVFVYILLCMYIIINRIISIITVSLSAPTSSLAL